MVRVLLYNCLTAVADNSGLPDELVRLRKARGLTQEDVIERAQYPGYPRLEQGTRNASRRALLLIGSDGFHLADAESFDRLLQSAGFPPVTDEEIKNWRIVARPLPREMVRPAHPDPQCLPVVDVPEQQIETENAVQAEDDKLGEELHDAGTLSLTARQSDRSIATVVIWALTAIACAILSYWIETLPAGLIAVLCVLYAALFPVSLFLETAYHQPLAQTGRAASIVFCGILLTTMVVFLAVDRLGSQYPLPAFIGSVFIFAGSAFVQWFSVRNMLSERRSVESDGHVLSSQAAHLKNTIYFLSSPLCFLMPCTLGILQLPRITGAGATLNSTDLSFEAGLGPLRPAVFWILFGVFELVTIPMGFPFLDRLPDHPAKNKFTLFYFARAFLYFLVNFACLSWYTLALRP